MAPPCHLNPPRVQLHPLRKAQDDRISLFRTRHPRGNGHRHLAAAAGRAWRAAWPVPPGRSGAGSVGLPRSSAASAKGSRPVHRSRTTRLFLVSQHPDERHRVSATVGLALCLALSLHEVLTSGWMGSSNEAGQANNRPTELSSPRPPDPAASQSRPRRAPDAWVAGPDAAARRVDGACFPLRALGASTLRTATKPSPSIVSTVRPRLVAARGGAAVRVRGACSQVARVN